MPHTAEATSGPREELPEAAARPRAPSLPQLVLELRDLVVAYVRQETIVPLRRLGRSIGLGIAGAVLLGLGVLFLALGALRALQTETGTTFAGDWSWVPYLIVLAGLLGGGVLTWAARGTRRSSWRATERE